MSGSDSPNPSGFGLPDPAGSALPPPNGSAQVPPTSGQPGPYPGAPPSAYAPAWGTSQPGPSAPSGPSGQFGQSGQSGGGGRIPLVVWFLIGIFVLGGALAAFFLTRGDDSDNADEPRPSATTIAGEDRSAAEADEPIATTTAPVVQAPVTTNAEPATPTTNAEPATPSSDTESATPSSDAETDEAGSDSPDTDPPPPPSVDIEALADGEYTVGTDIEPGVYRVNFEPEDEYDTYSFSIHNPDGFLKALEIGIGEWTLMVVPDEVGTTIDLSGGAVPIAATGPVNPRDYDAGTYVVGYDIEPGTYELSGESISYARLDDEMHEIGSASANDGDSLEFTIKPTDFAVEIEGLLVPVG